MGSSTIRKAIGVVKDQTSISIAKVAGTVAPDLEVLIVKATGHDIEPAEEKYIREILHRISHSRAYVSACVYNISKRLSKTHDWVVALKVLMLVHRLLVDGDPVFGQEIMCARRKGTRVLNMSDFRVEALSNYWDHSGFVKNYAMYLDQKLEFIAFERKLNGVHDRWRFQAEYGYLRDEPSYGISHKSKSYGDLHESVGREKSRDEKMATLLREMKPDRVLERLDKLLRLLHRVLSCRPAGSAKSSRMVLVALYLVLKESFRIYADICEALRVLIDRFPEMEYANGVKTFDEYVKAAKTIDELVDFYSWSKELGVARPSEFPEVQKLNDKVLVTLERFLREKKNQLKNNGGEGYKDNGTPPAPAVQTTEDLLNLKDDTTLAKGSWEVFPYTGESDKTSAWQMQEAKGGKADWELALVGSTSNLPKPKADVAGLDPLMLNDMYNQGAVTQYTNYNPVGDGSYTSLVVSGLGRSGTPVLALPAPNETIQPVDPQDPFAASLTVPPPPYVQLADLEKKQSFLVQEQQVRQQYGSNGMLGQGPLGQINAGVSAYNGIGQQAGYNYAHY